MQFDWSRAFGPISQEPDFSPFWGQKNVRLHITHYRKIHLSMLKSTQCCNINKKLYNFRVADSFIMVFLDFYINSWLEFDFVCLFHLKHQLEKSGLCH